MSEIENWTSLVTRLEQLGCSIASHAIPEVKRNDDSQGDIRLMAVTLIARSLSNSTGVLALIEASRIVEARTIVRCVFENGFWAGAFAENPEKFRQDIIDHDLKKRGAHGQRLFESGELPNEIEDKLRQWMKKNSDWKKAKTITPLRVAKDAQLGDAYLFYDQLSADAHPTIHALNRYVVEPNGFENTDIDFEPPIRQQELVETVAYLCLALASVLLSACKILQSPLSDRVDALAREYLELMRRQSPQ